MSQDIKEIKENNVMNNLDINNYKCDTCLHDGSQHIVTGPCAGCCPQDWNVYKNYTPILKYTSIQCPFCLSDEMFSLEQLKTHLSTTCQVYGDVNDTTFESEVD